MEKVQYHPPHFASIDASCGEPLLFTEAMRWLEIECIAVAVRESGLDRIKTKKKENANVQLIFEKILRERICAPVMALLFLNKGLYNGTKIFNYFCAALYKR